MLYIACFIAGVVVGAGAIIALILCDMSADDPVMRKHRGLH